MFERLEKSDIGKTCLTNFPSPFTASEAASTVSDVSSASSTVKKVEVVKKDPSGAAVATNAVKKDAEPGKNNIEENGDDEPVAAGGEDTMQNLRKSFAGIFGDIKQ